MLNISDAILGTSRIMYIHGNESDGYSDKARQFREWFPGMVSIRQPTKWIANPSLPEPVKLASGGQHA